MRGVNNVILSRQASRDAELRRTQSGKAVSSIRLATNRPVAGEEVVAEKVQFLSRQQNGWRILALPCPSATPASAELAAAAAVAFPSAGLAGLTIREIEVLRLVARGLSIRQVAEHLSLSPRTVNSHLTTIYSKLGVTSRGAAIRFALDHNVR